MKKICFISPLIYPLLTNHQDINLIGGAEVQQNILIKELDNKGYDISVVTLDYGQDSLVKVGKNIKIYKMSSKNKNNFIKNSFIFPFLLYKILKKINANIYYQRKSSFYTGIVAYFCKKNNKKFIFSAAHDNNTKKFPFKRNNIIALLRDTFLYHYGIKNSDMIIVQNEYQKKMFKKNYKISSILINSTYKLRKKEKKNKKEDIIWVGRIIDMKRPDLFIYLSLFFNNMKFQLIGPPENKNLFTKILNMKRNNNLKIIGLVPYKKIDCFFDKALLLINTSKSEGFPNTFLQAFSRGIPVISSVNPSEIITNYNLGYHCKDKKNFINSINLLLNNKKLYNKFSSNCKAYFNNNHSVNKIIPKYESLFINLLKK